nr:Methyltransferase domain protein [uncultured bacterium]
MAEELVVLVDEQNNELGTMEKLAAHNANTPLHRAFSLFLFNGKGELLVQQRSRYKKTWPLVWSNSCCGHPGPKEQTVQAIHRRLKDELGLENIRFELILPNYRYRFERDGIVENEVCPVYIGRCDKTPAPNPAEVEAVKFVPWAELLEIAGRKARDYSEWSLDEALLLEKNPKFRKLRDSWYNA